MPNALFLTKDVIAGLEKVAITKLTRDPEKWEREILDALHEQNPFLQDFPIRFHLNKSDSESGMGVGQIVVSEKIAIPIIVDDLKLQPLDLFWHEGKLNPLSKETLEKAIAATSLGKPVAPGQGEVSDVSLYGATRVPFSGKYSFAENLTFTVDQLNEALATMGKEGVDYALRTNGSFRKTAAAYADAAGKEPMQKVAMAKIASVKPVAFEPFQDVSEPGFYQVLFDGIRKMSAMTFNKVVDWEGEIIPRQTVVYGLDGSFAVTEKVGGIKKLAEAEMVPEDITLEDVGFFWSVRGGAAIATMPGRVMYSGTNEDGVPFVKIAELSTGREKTVVMSPEYDGIHAGDDMLFLDTDWQWSTVKKTSSVSDATTANECAWPAHTVEVRNRGNLYSLHGLDIPELPKEGATVDVFYRHVSKMLDSQDLLALMQTAEKKGSAFGEIPTGFDWKEDPVINKYAGLLPNFRIKPINLVREAAHLRPCQVEFFKYAQEVTNQDVDNTVDSLLGLNFITEENVGKFIEKIAMLEEARDVLAKTLLSARLGLRMEQGPVKTALFSVDNVIRQLRYLRDYASML
jgi:hypothetical protein